MDKTTPDFLAAADVENKTALMIGGSGGPIDCIRTMGDPGNFTAAKMVCSFPCSANSCAFTQKYVASGIGPEIAEFTATATIGDLVVAEARP